MSSNEESQAKPENNKADTATSTNVTDNSSGTPTPQIVVKPDSFINFALLEASKEKDEKKKEDGGG